MAIQLRRLLLTLLPAISLVFYSMRSNLVFTITDSNVLEIAGKPEPTLVLVYNSFNLGMMKEYYAFIHHVAVYKSRSAENNFGTIDVASPETRNISGLLKAQKFPLPAVIMLHNGTYATGSMLVKSPEKFERAFEKPWTASKRAVHLLPSSNTYSLQDTLNFYKQQWEIVISDILTLRRNLLALVVATGFGYGCLIGMV